MGTIGTATSTALHIPGAPPAAPPGILLSLPPMPALGINELMQYLSGYMNKSDADLRSKMADLKTNKDKAEQLGKITEMLNGLAGKVDSGKITDPDSVKKVRDLIAKNPDLMKGLSADGLKALTELTAAAQVDVNCTVACGITNVPVDPGAYADESGQIFNPDGSPIFTASGAPLFGEIKREETCSLSKDAVDAASKVIAQELSTNTSANELKMIELQSAISARGNLLSMVSNMVKSFDDNAKSIVGNMR
jgi:hypothetical protein